MRNAITNNGNGRLIGWGDRIELENEEKKGSKYIYTVIRSSPIRNGFISPHIIYHFSPPNQPPNPPSSSSSPSSTLIFILPPHPSPSDLMIDTLSIDHHHYDDRDADRDEEELIEVKEIGKGKRSYDASVISHRILNFGLSNSLISPINHRELTAHLLTSPLPSHLIYSPPSSSFPSLSSHIPSNSNNNNNNDRRGYEDKGREVYVTLQTLKYLQITNGSFVSIHLSTSPSSSSSSSLSSSSLSSSSLSLSSLLSSTMAGESHHSKEEEGDGRYSKGYIVQLFAVKSQPQPIISSSLSSLLSSSSLSPSPSSPLGGGGGGGVQLEDNILYIPSPIAHHFHLTRFHFKSSIVHPPLLPYHFIIKLLPIPSLQTFNGGNDDDPLADDNINNNNNSKSPPPSPSSSNLHRDDHHMNGHSNDQMKKDDQRIKKGFGKIKEISISLIRNKHMERNMIAKQFFMEYFEKVKLISKGDVIAVPIRKLKYFDLPDNSNESEKEYMDLLSSSSLIDPSSVVHQSIYFYVNDIKLSYDHLSPHNNSFAHWKVVNNLEDTGYYDLHSSLLYQSSSIHSSLPFSFDSYLSLPPSSSFPSFSVLFLFFKLFLFCITIHYY